MRISSGPRCALPAALLTLCCCILSLPLGAQQAPTSASVSGTVYDSGGSPIAGARATITHLERNQTQTAVADREGRFRFPVLAVGDYRLDLAAAGFAPWQRRLQLTVGTALEVPVTLGATFAESITVAAAAPILELETARTQVASTISPEEVHDLPLNGRNYLDLALLAPGVSRTNTGANQRFAETSAVPGTGISVSSQRNLANSFIVDGLSANDDAAELAGTFFSQEVIREFAVVRSGGIAEFGRASAGIINIVTQSGTNTPARRRLRLLPQPAASTADNALSHSKLPLDQQQYGASLGGPLVRDRDVLLRERRAAAAADRRDSSPSRRRTSPRSTPGSMRSGYRGPRIATGGVRHDARHDERLRPRRPRRRPRPTS